MNGRRLKESISLMKGMQGTVEMDRALVEYTNTDMLPVLLKRGYSYCGEVIAAGGTMLIEGIKEKV